MKNTTIMFRAGKYIEISAGGIIRRNNSGGINLVNLFFRNQQTFYRRTFSSCCTDVGEQINLHDKSLCGNKSDGSSASNGESPSSLRGSGFDSKRFIKNTGGAGGSGTGPFNGGSGTGSVSGTGPPCPQCGAPCKHVDTTNCE